MHINDPLLVSENIAYVVEVADVVEVAVRCSSMVRAFVYGVMGCQIDHSLSCFLIQPVLHDWCNKGHGMCYPVIGMVHIK